MEPSEIKTLAEACYSRGGLAGFQEGNIRLDEERFTLSPVEAASIERAIRRVKAEESILIEASFPGNSVPVGLAVALAYSEHPQMGGANSPVLLFPRQGYTTVFDRFHFKEAADWSSQPNSQPIPRSPVESLSAMESTWGVCTANSQFRFDLAECSTLPTAIIIDLRAPRWNDTYARQLVELFAAAQKGRIVFIGDADGDGTGYRLARTHGDEKLRIAPEHLESSPIDRIPIELDTKLAAVEETLATRDVTYDYYSIVDSKIDDLHRQFAAKKIELQERGLAPAAVGGLYNRLTQLPAKPEYWNRVSDAHGYFDSVPQQIDYLELISERTERGASRIQNFIETARQVEATLNEQHKLQNYLLNALERARETQDETRFVFSNERIQEAFILAAEENGISAGANTGVTLTTRSDAEPSPDAITVCAGAAPHESTHYEFPLSKTVAFVNFAILDSYVSSRGQSLSGDTVTHTKHTVGERGEDLDPIDLDDIEGDVKQAVGPVDSDSATAASESGLMGGASLWGTGDTQSTKPGSEGEKTPNETPTTRTDTGPSTQLRISFEEPHEPIELRPLSRVTKYYPDEGDIDRTRAKSLERGDTIILLDDVADDIYDIVVDNASELESVREDIDLIEGWRDQLNQALENDEWSVKEFQKRLEEMGSNITSPVTVSLWRYGTTIAPEDPDDIRRVYQLCRPGIDASMFDTLAGEIHQAAERLRERHQKIGNRIRSLIEYELDATTSSSQPEYYDEETRRRIREDTKRLTVAGIESETITKTGQDKDNPASEPAND